MHPLLTFSAGLAAGIAAIRLLKNQKTQSAAASGRDKVRSGLDSAQETLRGAAIAGLSAVEHSSARLRTRLTPAPEVDEPAPVAAAPARKTARKTARPTAEQATPAPKRGRKKAAKASDAGGQS